MRNVKERELKRWQDDPELILEQRKASMKRSATQATPGSAVRSGEAQ